MVDHHNRAALRTGVSLKPAHYRVILEERPVVSFFEIHAENFMGAGGPPHRYLSEIRSRYELTVHGVGLSLGGARSIDCAHLARLQAVVDRYEPAIVSEHLAWSSHDDRYLGDLLPIPYTPETLSRVASHVHQVQEALGRQILIENPSTYLRCADSALSECEFLEELAVGTGCGLLLDVNNVHVSAVNHGADAEAWIDAFPIEHARQIHLGGHTEEADGNGRPLLIDTHDKRTCQRVWELYERAVRRAGALPTLIEWDADLPPWHVLQAEAIRADSIIRSMDHSRERRHAHV